MTRIRNNITAGRKKVVRRARRIERSVRRNSRMKALVLTTTTLMAMKNAEHRVVMPVHGQKPKVESVKKVRQNGRRHSDTARSTAHYNAPTAAQVMAYADSAGASHPRELTAQLVLESGWFRSYISRTRNNIGGIGGPGNYRAFVSWEACVDYVISMQKRAGLKEGQDYFSWLNRAGYHGSDKAAYNALVMRIMKRL